MPAMPFARTGRQLADLTSAIPGVTAVHDLPTPKGRGVLMNAVITTIFNNRVFDPIRPSYTLLEFG